jgi:hypothetical protein
LPFEAFIVLRVNLPWVTAGATTPIRAIPPAVTLLQRP